MWQMYKYVLKHPQTRCSRQVSRSTIIIFLQGQFFTLPNLRTFIVVGKRDTLSSGIRTTYPLGNILWEQGIWKLRYTGKNIQKVVAHIFKGIFVRLSLLQIFYCKVNKSPITVMSGYFQPSTRNCRFLFKLNAFPKMINLVVTNLGGAL